MKDLILGILLLILTSEVFILYQMNESKNEKRVLGQTEVAAISQSPSPVVTPTLEPTPTPTLQPTPRPTPIKTPTPVPQPTFTSEQINGFIDRFAGLYGVDPNVLRHIAICESGFDPSASKLSYAGLYQFGPTTWKNIRIKMGEDVSSDTRFNAEEAVQTAAYVLSIKNEYIWPNCTP